MTLKEYVKENGALTVEAVTASEREEVHAIVTNSGIPKICYFISDRFVYIVDKGVVTFNTRTRDKTCVFSPMTAETFIQMFKKSETVLASTNKDCSKYSEHVLNCIKKLDDEEKLIEEINNMENMFKDAKIGDRVWSILKGWGVVTDTRSYDLAYPLQVKFEDDMKLSFTLDGKNTSWSLYPTLFWQEFEIPAKAYERPLPDIPVDTLVWVWFDGEEHNKRIRCFSHFEEDGNCATFDDGLSSNSTSEFIVWDNYELA